MVARKKNVKKDGEPAVSQTVVIAPPNYQTAAFKIRGTAPLMLQRFSEKAKQEMKQKQEKGSKQAKKKTDKKPKDFEALYKGAMYVSDEGWCGINAAGFRCGMISQCRIAGFKMTQAKLCIFCEADGYDKIDGTPLVKITKGKPIKSEMWARIPSTGSPDIRARPMWKPGWEAIVKIRFDADIFSLEDVSNLIARMGLSGGIGEGRPDSRMSCGIGMGLFEIALEA